MQRLPGAAKHRGQYHRSRAAETVLNKTLRGLAERRQFDIVEPKSTRRTLAERAPISGCYFKKVTEHDQPGEVAYDSLNDTLWFMYNGAVKV